MTKTLTEQIVHIQNDLDVVFADVVKLEKRLEIATKALKEYERCENGSYANKALTLIKEVK